MSKTHLFNAQIKWTGKTGSGTVNASAYKRNHTISIKDKVDILGCSASAFRGDDTKHNPEDLFISALSTCHMLWYLHICADNGIVITDYIDNVTGTMIEVPGGGGHFTEVTLHPIVTITDKTKIDLANALHSEANKKCFIANSSNFKITHHPTCLIHS